MLRQELEPARAFLMLAHQDSGFYMISRGPSGRIDHPPLQYPLLFHLMAQGILPAPGRAHGDPQ